MMSLTIITSRVYYSIPFLHEIKALIDWTFQNTFLTFAQWLHLSQIKHHFSLQEKNLSTSSFIKSSLKIILTLLLFSVFLAPCFLISTYGIWLPTSYDINVETTLNLQIGSNLIELFKSHRYFWTQSVERTQFDQNILPSIFNNENTHRAQAVYLSRYPDGIFKYSRSQLAPLISSIENILQKTKNNEKSIQSINQTTPVIVSIQTTVTQTQTLLTPEVSGYKNTEYSLINTTDKSQVEKNLKALLNLFDCQENKLHLTKFYDPSIFLSQDSQIQQISSEGCQDILLGFSCQYNPEKSIYSYGSWSFETNQSEHSEPFFLTVVQLPLIYIKLIQIIYIAILKLIWMFLRSRIEMTGIENFQAASGSHISEVYEKILKSRAQKKYLSEIQEYENLKVITQKLKFR